MAIIVIFARCGVGAPFPRLGLFALCSGVSDKNRLRDSLFDFRVAVPPVRSHALLGFPDRMGAFYDVVDEGPNHLWVAAIGSIRRCSRSDAVGFSQQDSFGVRPAVADGVLACHIPTSVFRLSRKVLLVSKFCIFNIVWTQRLDMIVDILAICRRAGAARIGCEPRVPWSRSPSADVLYGLAQSSALNRWALVSSRRLTVRKLACLADSPTSADWRLAWAKRARF